MRAVVDARAALDPRRTGIGHYAKQIVKHLPAADPGSMYVAWHLDPFGSRRDSFRDVAPNLEEVAGRFPNRWFEPVSSRLGVPRIDRSVGHYDVLLATNFLPPATRGSRCVPVVHDLAFDLLPQTAPHVDRRWRRRLALSLTGAPRVIVPSASTRADLVRLYAVDPERVDVVPHGTDSEFTPAAPAVVDDVRRRFGITAGPYALFVGGIEPRKNLETMVRAFGQVAQEDTAVQLVVAGGSVRWFPQAAADLDTAVARLSGSAGSRVIRPGYVSDEERTALFTGATLLAYPSLYEGFGFPLLEAFAAGVPALTSTVSSLPEVAGDAAVLVDPDDESSIAQGLRDLFFDEGLRQRMIEAGRRRVLDFSWGRCASATAEVLHRACS